MRAATDAGFRFYKHSMLSTSFKMALPSYGAAYIATTAQAGQLPSSAARQERHALAQAGWTGRYRHLTRATTLQGKVNSIIPQYFFSFYISRSARISKRRNEYMSNVTLLFKAAAASGYKKK